MTIYNPQGKARPVKTGRYRQLVTTPIPQAALPPTAGRYSACLDCEKMVGLAEKVASLEAWRMNTMTDLKTVLEVIQQAKILMALSITGGLLSLVSLVLTFISLVNRNF